MKKRASIQGKVDRLKNTKNKTNDCEQKNSIHHAKVTPV